MPSGRSADRDRDRGRAQSAAARRSGRARGGTSTSKDLGAKRGSTAKKRASGRNAVRSGSGTGGAFKLTSTRRASVLALLVCTMALSVSVPLRTYLSQRDELATQREKQTQLTEQIDELEKRKAKLSDPDHVEAEARARLGYVRPGETPYIVQVPKDRPEPPNTEQEVDDTAWYEQLWESLAGEGS